MRERRRSRIVPESRLNGAVILTRSPVDVAALVAAVERW
jgi:hypothetical protein